MAGEPLTSLLLGLPTFDPGGPGDSELFLVVLVTVGGTGELFLVLLGTCGGPGDSELVFVRDLGLRAGEAPPFSAVCLGLFSDFSLGLSKDLILGPFSTSVFLGPFVSDTFFFGL